MILHSNDHIGNVPSLGVEDAMVSRIWKNGDRYSRSGNCFYKLESRALLLMSY